MRIRDVDLDGKQIVKRYREMAPSDLAADAGDDPFILEVLLARIAELEAECESVKSRLAHYEPTEGCEEAWQEYVDLRKQIRRCKDDAVKDHLMARAMEVARPFDFESIELRECRAECERLRAGWDREVVDGGRRLEAEILRTSESVVRAERAQAECERLRGESAEALVEWLTRRPYLYCQHVSVEPGIALRDFRAAIAAGKG